MASGKGQIWSSKLLNALFNNAVYSFPATLYIALYSVAPTAVAGSGTEASGGSYARVSVACNTTNWPTIGAAVTTITSGAAFTFPTATADWSSAANMVAATIMDASSSGNEYYFGSLTENKPVLNGDTASFASGAITVQEQ